MERPTFTRTVVTAGRVSDESRREIDVASNAAGTAISLMAGIAFELSGSPVRPLFIGTAVFAGAAVLASKRRYTHGARDLVLLFTMIGSVHVQWMAGGVVASGVNAIWGLVPILGAAWLGSRWSHKVWLAMYLLALGFEITLELTIGAPPVSRPAWFPVVIGAANCALAASMIAIVSGRITAERARSADALAAEYQRSESLLLNILPKPIAKRLKDSPGRIADRYDEVTVLFADIVGFTELSSRVSASELVQTLDSLFRELDRIATQYGLEKIKTIGDSYMAVAGAPVPRIDHASVAAEAATGMLAAIKSHPDGLSVRIGIESGPVVAGVIGSLKFSWDLWGATVNMASRMESHGIAGEIHVGPGAHERLRADWDLEPRQAVPIKGVGTLDTWLLRGRSVARAVRP